MLLQITELISQAVHGSFSLQFGKKKKELKLVYYCVLGRFTHCDLLPRGLQGEHEIPSCPLAKWDRK